jgi:hypothetical protein
MKINKKQREKSYIKKGKPIYENHSHNGKVCWIKYLISTERVFTPKS